MSIGISPPMEWPMLKQTALLVLGFTLMALPALAKPAIVTGNTGQTSYAVRCHLVKIVGVHWVRRCS
jgi:hypothetical protein